MAFTTSDQETEWAYSYSPGAHTGPDCCEREQANTYQSLRQLLKRYPAAVVNFIWFSVATSSNPQNGQLYIGVNDRKKRVAWRAFDAYTRLTFSPAFGRTIGTSCKDQQVILCRGYMWNKTLNFFQNYFKIISFTCDHGIRLLRVDRDILQLDIKLKQYPEQFTSRQDGAPAHMVRDPLNREIQISLTLSTSAVSNCCCSKGQRHAVIHNF